MYSDADLDSAVGAGALSAEAAASFRDFISRQRATPAVDEEHFRLLTGFNDIFVSIALVVLLFALNWLAKELGAMGDGAVITAVSWGLAEYFTRRRRMALPSILLLISFAAGVFLLADSLIAPGHGQPVTGEMLGLASVATAAAVYGHWRRFMVPITPAIGCFTLIFAAVVTAGALMPSSKSAMPSLFLVGGLAVFVWAMRWDMSDPGRTTRRTDVAFWLHLTAAPMMVHPIFTMLGLSGFSFFTFNTPYAPTVGLEAAAIAVAIYLGLAFVALAIDRRALLVSALFYVLYAIATLFKAAGSLTLNLALTGVVIGSGLLLLSAFWHGARVLVIRTMPQAIRARLPAV
jgi:hypothetical protein